MLKKLLEKEEKLTEEREHLEFLIDQCDQVGHEDELFKTANRLEKVKRKILQNLKSELKRRSL